MPEFEVETTDGRIVTVDAPSAADAGQRVSAMLAAEKRSGQKFGDGKPESGRGLYANIRDPLAQGLTFGFADEAAAGLGTVGDVLRGDFDVKGNYNRRVAEHRADLEDAKKNHPVLSTVSEIAGSIPTMLIPGLNAAKGATWARGVLNAAKAGAKSGLISGAGAAEGGLEERAKGAAGGAAGGAVAASGLTGLTSGAGRAGRFVGEMFPDSAPVRGLRNARQWLSDKTGLVDPPKRPGEDYANRKVLESIGADDTNLNRIEKRLNAFEREGQGGNTVLADLAGTNVRRRGDAIVTIPNRERNKAVRTLTNRTRNEGQQIASDLEKAAETTGAFDTVRDGIIEARQRAAAPLYNTLYAKPEARAVNDAFINDILERPYVDAAAKHVKKAAETSGTPIEVWDLPSLNKVKMEIDDVLYNDKRNLTNTRMSQNTINSLEDARKQLVARLDELFPGDYAAARAAWGGPSKLKEAAELGQTFPKMTESQVKEFVSKASPAEKHLFLTGAVDSLRTQIENSPRSKDLYALVFKNESKRAALRQLFMDSLPTPQKGADNFRRFSNQMYMRQLKNNTDDAIFKNSRTTSRQQEVKDFATDAADEVLDVLPQAATGNWFGAATNLAGKIGNRIGGRTGSNAAEATKLLFGNPRIALGQLRGAVDEFQRNAAKPQLLPGLLGERVGAAVGSQRREKRASR